MKRLFSALFLLFAALCASAQTTTTITGTIRDLSNAVVTSGQVVFTPIPVQSATISGTARFTATPITCSIINTGAVKALDGVSNCTLMTTTATSPTQGYKACIQPQFADEGNCFNIAAIGTSIDISTVVFTPASVPFNSAFVDTFTDQTIGGNKTFTGNITHNGHDDTGIGNVGAVTGMFSGAVSTGAITASGNINAGSNSLTAGAGTFTSVTSPSNMLANVDNRIYVDGVKYPLTQAGLQQAFTDACAITGTQNNGTVVYIPPGSINLNSSVTITCPLIVKGSGIGQTGISSPGDVFTLSPSANFSQNQQWDISGILFFTTAGRGIFVNDATFNVNSVRIHDNQFNVNCTASSTCGAIQNSTNPGSTVQEQPWTIEWNVFTNGGIILNTDVTGAHGVADGLMIRDNFWLDTSTANTPCMQVNAISGAAQITVMHNTGGCAGGAIVSSGVLQLNILFNQFEQAVASTEANSALIDLKGDTFTIGGANIYDNNLNAHSNATNNIRLDHVTNANLDLNTITENPAGVGILTTANANPVYPGNNFYTGGGTNFSGSGTFLANFASTSFVIGNIAPTQRVLFNSGNAKFEYQFFTSAGAAAGVQIGGSDWFENSSIGNSATGHARMWADSSSHTFKVNNNAGSTFSLTETVGSGTGTTAGTAVAAGTSQSISITVTGATTTDVAECSTNSAYPATWLTGITVLPPAISSANTVTLTIVNGTAASITPAAQTFRCTVTR